MTCKVCGGTGCEACDNKGGVCDRCAAPTLCDEGLCESCARDAAILAGTYDGLDEDEDNDPNDDGFPEDEPGPYHIEDVYDRLLDM